jgi:hypothetical protein
LYPRISAALRSACDSTFHLRVRSTSPGPPAAEPRPRTGDPLATALPLSAATPIGTDACAPAPLLSGAAAPSVLGSIGGSEGSEAIAGHAMAVEQG